MRRCAARLSGISALLLCAACIHDQQDPVTLAPDQDAYIRFDQLLVSARKEQIAADRVYDGKIYMDSALTPALVSVPLVYRARQCGIDTASTRPMLEIFLAARGMPQPDVEEFMSFYDAAAPTFPDTLLADAGEASTPVMPPANAIWADTRTTGAGAATSRAPLPWTQPASNAAVQSGQGEVLPWQNSGTTSYSSSATNSGYYSRYATPEPYTPPTQADVRYAVQTDIGNATGVPVTEDQQRRASIDATGIDLTPWLQ